MHKKSDALKQSDKAKVKAIQRDIDKQITADKQRFKAKLEDSFKGNNPRQYWKGIETITGYKARKSQLQAADNARLAEELNSFYTRFDKEEPNFFYTLFDKEELNSFYNRSDKEELNSFYTRFDKEELNSFYVRFDKNDFSEQQNVAMEEVRYRPSQPVQISQEAVRNCFLKAKIHSAAGPDNISGRTLKESSDSLAPVFNHLFQRSLDKGIIP